MRPSGFQSSLRGGGSCIKQPEKKNSIGEMTTSPDMTTDSLTLIFCAHVGSNPKNKPRPITKSHTELLFYCRNPPFKTANERAMCRTVKLEIAH